MLGSLTLLAALLHPADASALVGLLLPLGWDQDALLAGYQNSAEASAFEVECDALPADLIGTYYRNGPARFIGYDGKRVRHPFDGDGMVVAVTLDGRKRSAVVRQRFVATRGAVSELEAQRTLFPGLFGNPRPIWSGGAAVKNLANANVLYHAGELLALWEGGRPHRLDPLSLATMGESTLGGLLGDGRTDTWSAHPRRSANGGLSNFAYFGNPASGKTTVRFYDFKADSWELISPVQEHTLDGFGLYHDFLVTKGWFIIIDAGARWGSGGVKSLFETLEWALGKRSIASMISMEASRPVTVHLYPRSSCQFCESRSIPLDSFFAFHHANAFEDNYNGVITVDTAAAASAGAAVSDGAPKGGGDAESGGDFLVEDIDWDVDVPRQVSHQSRTSLARVSHKSHTSLRANFPHTCHAPYVSPLTSRPSVFAG